MPHSTPSSEAEALSRRRTLVLAAGAAGGLMLAAPTADAASRAEIDSGADTALARLYSTTPAARSLGPRARAIMIFPKIAKAGFIVGGQGGSGVLREGGRSVGYFSIGAGSFGLEAGVQTFSYVMFFMTQSALDYVKSNSGWSIGVGPTVAVINAGAAATLDTNTARSDIYAFPFGQQGLMAGVSLQGSKISRINPA